MVTFIFKLDPRKGQLHVKIGYIMSNFKIQNFPLQICLSCADLSQDSKNVICFYVRQLEMPKIAFQKCDVITFTWFSGHCTAKNKDIALKFCVRVFVSIPSMYIQVFWITWKFRILQAIILKNKFEFWGQNGEISKIRDRRFENRSILRHLVFFDGVLLQN